MIVECVFCGTGLMKRGCKKIIKYTDGDIAFAIYLAKKYGGTVDIYHYSMGPTEHLTLKQGEQRLKERTDFFQGKYICRKCFNFVKFLKVKYPSQHEYEELEVEGFGSI